MRIASEPLSLQQFLRLPESEQPFEVVAGQPLVTPAPTRLHQRVLFRLAQVLAAACPQGFEVLTSPIDWVLWTEPTLQVRQPDIAVVSYGGEEGPRLTRPPLLAVEVLSPDAFERDVVTKRDEYARAGLEHYWIVDPAVPEIVVYRATSGHLAPIDRASGVQLLVVREPFGVDVQPSQLVVPR